MDIKIIAIVALVLAVIAVLAIIAITPALVEAGIVTLGKPSGCNYDGSCQGWEDPTCPDCTGGATTTVAITTTTIVSMDCGDGYCAGQDLGEDCYSCPADCPGKTTGSPKYRYCCGNYGCEIVGEDSDNCPVDCGPPPTTTTIPPTTTTIMNVTTTTIPSNSTA